MVVDRNLSSRSINFHTPARIPVAVAEAEGESDIVMVEPVSVRCPDYLVDDCRERIDWVVAAGFLY